eukprot:XP_014780069.1 PREDICTED: uncharacterized protein LOC106876157 [Octopus bimaculoides]
MKSKDKYHLGKVINECLASGIIELKDDIQQARKTLNILEGGTGEIKSPDVLRNQLAMAVRRKDIATLKKIIVETEDAKYPELGIDLSKARHALKSLSGSWGGVKSPESLREQLKAAQTGRNKEKLEYIISECIAAGFPELNSDIYQARIVLKDLEMNPKQERSSADFLRDELKKAAKSRDKSALERIIGECEQVAYPEIGFDLMEAREILKEMSGSHGGNLSMNTLREKLKDAIKERDKTTLDDVIRKCVASGIPQLQADIHQARKVSDILDGGTGDLKSSNMLRTQLQDAVRQKSISDLDNIIQEAENLAYPEIATDLRHARETLKYLGGGRGGKLSPDSLRKKLRAAVTQGNKKELRRVISDCVAAGMPELDNDVEKARQIMQDLVDFSEEDAKTPEALRYQLKKAVKEKDVSSLKRLIRICEEVSYPELAIDFRKARDTLNSLGEGLGGTKSFENLHENLKEAIKMKDARYLEKVVRDSVVSGMPGLEADIQKARNILDILGGGRGDLKTPDILRDQLEIAIRRKDIPSLEKVVAECETLGYPELATDLRKARNILESLGRGRGGLKSPEMMQKRLELAMKDRDKEKLEAVIDECVAAGMPELDLLIIQARDTLENMEEYPQTGSRSPETLRNQLKKATKQRDKSALDRIIVECENAGYPELGLDLLKARSTLENLGGGRGGTLTPESLREKLWEAVATMDQDELDNVIMECIAAGLPELDADIEKARKISQDLEMQRHRDIQSPDSLRKQLALAMKQKDASRLEKLIDECEETSYPELGSDLRKARITLESLGGGRGGTMSPDYLRDKLKSAMETKDKEALDKAIRTSIAAGMPDLEVDIQEARRMSDILAGGDGERECPFYLRDNLAKAIRCKDPQALNDAIKRCEEAGYPELGSDVRKARDVLESLGGGRGGTKSPLQLEENLITAMNAGDKEKLESAINECIAAGMPELDNTITEARNILGALKESEERGSMCPETLRKKLNDAMKLKDKITLNKAIRECVIAGFPEMDADIQQARDLSDKLGGGTGDKKSPIFLRNQLLRDMRKKDPENLKKSIQECEEAGYPELASDLRKARDALESLGGGRGGILSPFALREELQKAVMEGNIEDIEEILDKCIAAGMLELDSDIEYARSKLDERRKYEASPDTLRRELQKAIEARNMAALEKVISQCEDAGHPELNSDLRDAKDILESLSDGRGGSTTPDSLRNQLKRAVTQKNKANLEKAIHDAEAAGYPELAYDLRKARETLEKLGGGRGGIKTPESVREALKYAMKEADEPALERAIKDATAAGFPELASDVQKARDKLDLLRGGRGATKSAESLKKMLHDAVAMKNKSALEQAIKECEAAAYPELSYDLREARDALENIGGGRGGSKSPDILRNKLKSAIRQKDPNAIEKAISECVAAGHPELTGDIQQARDTLNSIGGVHKAPKSPSVLRDQLDHAVKQKDIIGLERAIAEAEAAKSPELSSNIKQARDLLDSLDGGSRSRSLSPEQVGTLLDQINTSIIHKDKPKLEKAIADAEPYRHPDLEPQIQKARPLLDALNIKDKLESAFLTDNQDDIRRCVIEIEQKNLTDYLSIEVNEARSRIRGYAAPDPSAFLNRDDVSIDSRTSSRMGWYMRSAGFSHDLLISALVVLGEYERHSESQAWRNYQHFFDISNSDGSSRRVLGFDIDQIYQNLSARADEILTRNSTDEVQLLNRSGQMSYSWSRSLNEQMRAYFHNLNGTMGGGESSFGETHSMSQMSGTSRTDYRLKRIVSRK